jgi:hypothetical protein
METLRLPEQLLPDLRGKWVKLVGAREVVQHAAQAMQAIEAEYQTTLNVCLRILGLDPGKNWRVNLETGEIGEVTAEDVVRQQNGQASAPDLAPGLSPHLQG